MNVSEILNLSAMPAASPSYPRGPYRFVNREYLIIAYLSDPEAIRAAAQTVRNCSVCGNLDSCDPCTICANSGRESRICVVETVADLWALERALIYRGAYHVLGGSLSALELRQAARERLPETMLPNRVVLVEELPMTKSSKLDERLLLAAAGLQPVDGAATGHYLAEKIKSVADIPISRLAQGVPMGGALEVLDEGTLATALRARRLA